MSKSYKELVDLYENIFKPAYADLVAYIGDKPIDILIEIENTLSHIFVALNDNEQEEIRKSNIEKAYNHLIRATLDCYKLLWVKLNEDIDRIFEIKTKRLALNISEYELIKLRNSFKEKAKEARKAELGSTI